MCMYILVGGLEHEFYFAIQLGMSSSQLTFTHIFFRGVVLPPTRHGLPTQNISIMSYNLLCTNIMCIYN